MGDDVRYRDAQPRLRWIRRALYYTPAVAMGASVFFGTGCRVELGMAAVLSVLAVSLWKIPRWVTEDRFEDVLRTGVRDIAEVEELVDKQRKTWVQVLGGVAFLLGSYFAWRNWTTAQDGVVTGRFTAATEQLGAQRNDSGSPKIEVRLGAIHALERLAGDSERDHWAVMEMIAAYLREHAALTCPCPREDKPPASTALWGNMEMRADVQAATAVLRRRKWRLDPETEHIQLRKVALVGVDFSDTQMCRADFSGSCLESSRWEGAKLRWAAFVNSDLREAVFTKADLAHAYLQAADLRKAVLTEARLTDANLQGAKLAGAILTHADLSGALLDHADLRGGHLRGAIFTGALMRDVCLQGADLGETVGLTSSQREAPCKNEAPALQDYLKPE